MALAGTLMMVAPPPPAEAVVGGQGVTWRTPWAAQLLLDGRHSCSGSIIAPTWVLTAAHCVQGRKVSSMTLSIGEPRSGRGVVRAAKGVRVHPGYNPRTSAGDIALIQLYTAVRTGYARLGGHLRTGHRVEVYGWGRDRDSLPHRMKTASNRVTYISGGSIGVAPIDGYANFGDSGGPYFNSDKRQVGVDSRFNFKNPRTGAGHITRVDHYLGWIRGIARV